MLALCSLPRAWTAGGRWTRSWCTRTPKQATWARWRSSSPARSRPTCRRAPAPLHTCPAYVRARASLLVALDRLTYDTWIVRPNRVCWGWQKQRQREHGRAARSEWAQLASSCWLHGHWRYTAHSDAWALAAQAVGDRCSQEGLFEESVMYIHCYICALHLYVY